MPILPPDSRFKLSRKPKTKQSPSEGSSSEGLWLWCPLRVEARAAKRGAKASLVRHSGMGPKKSTAFVEQLLTSQEYKTAFERSVVIVGFGGGLKADDKPGDVIVASKVLGLGEAFEFPEADLLAQMLSSHDLAARTGVIHSADHVVLGKQRQELSDTGADVVEMESWWLLQAVEEANEKAAQAQTADTDRKAQPAAAETLATLGLAPTPLPTPQAVIRVLFDTPQRSLLGAVPGIITVSKVLSSAVAALETVTSSEVQP